MKTLEIERLDSPLGTILTVVDGDLLCALDYEDYEQRMMTLLQRRYGAVSLVPASQPYEINHRLQAYFAGDYLALENIPVSTGGTAFQQEVWLALRTIPPGTTISYGELAARLGRPTA